MSITACECREIVGHAAHQTTGHTAQADGRPSGPTGLWSPRFGASFGANAPQGLGRGSPPFLRGGGRGLLGELAPLGAETAAGDPQGLGMRRQPIHAGRGQQRWPQRSGHAVGARRLVTSTLPVSYRSLMTSEKSEGAGSTRGVSPKSSRTSHAGRRYRLTRFVQVPSARPPWRGGSLLCGLTQSPAQPCRQASWARACASWLLPTPVGPRINP
jgi:hypothetical protein